MLIQQDTYSVKCDKCKKVYWGGVRAQMKVMKETDSNKQNALMKELSTNDLITYQIDNYLEEWYQTLNRNKR